MSVPSAVHQELEDGQDGVEDHRGKAQTPDGDGSLDPAQSGSEAEV